MLRWRAFNARRRLKGFEAGELGMRDRIFGMVKRHRHVNWALADQGMVSGANFLTTILIARHLGIEEFGRFTLAWMVVLFTTSLQMAVVVSPMMSIGPKQKPEDAPTYFGALFLQLLVFVAITFFLIFAGVYLVAEIRPEWDLRSLAFPLAATAVLFQMRDFFRRYFFTRKRPAMAFAGDAVAYLGLLFLLFLLLPFFHFDGADILWLIGGASAAAVLIALPFLGHLAWRIGAFTGVCRRHWHFSKWMGASALLQWASANFFFIVAGAMLGAAAVGALRAAQALLGISFVFIQGLENVVPLRAAEHLTRGGKRALVAYLRRVAWLGGGATALVGLVAAIAPEFWLGLFFGESYVAYGHLLYWYAVIYVVIFASLPLRAGLRALERTRPIFLATVLAAVFSVTLAVPLIDTLGVMGAVVGLLIANLLLVAVFAGGLRREMGRDDGCA